MASMSSFFASEACVSHVALLGLVGSCTAPLHEQPEALGERESCHGCQVGQCPVHVHKVGYTVSHKTGQH